MDTLIYCSDIEQLEQELVANGYYDEESDAYTHGNSLTPIQSNGKETLSLVRDNQLDLDTFPSLTDLGDYEEMFADEVSHNLYKSVYPYDVPITYVDEDGNEQSYMRPIKIGEFA